MEPDYTNESCPVAKTMALIGGKWKIVILWRLSQKNQRYNELKKLINGITTTALTRALRELENDNLIKRFDYGKLPLHVVYSLSNRGRTLLPVLDSIKDWAKFNTE